MRSKRDRELDRLDRQLALLERRQVVHRNGSVGYYSPLRPGALAGLVLMTVLIVTMVLVGDLRVGRFPLAERLLAYDAGICFVSLVSGLLLLLAGRRRTRLRHAARFLLHTSFATLVAGTVVLACSDLLPLHLEGWL